MSIFEIIGIVFVGIVAASDISLVTYTLITEKRNVRKLKAIRQKLNDRLEETGSPARYYPNYSDWTWVMNYDEDPTEAATEFMERTLIRYNEYIAGEGDPKRIIDVMQF